MLDRIRTEPAIRFITFLRCLSGHDFHHDVGISGSRSNPDPFPAKRLHRFSHIIFRIGEPVQDAEKHLLKTVVHGVYIRIREISAVNPAEFFPDALHLQHSLDMVPFQHTHGSSCFFHRRFDSVCAEDFHKSLHRSKTSIVNRRPGPVEDHRFTFHAAAPFA